MFFDTHVHFEDRSDEHGIGPVVRRASDARVTAMLAVGGSPEGNAAAVAASGMFPRNVRAALGLDRHTAADEAVSGVRAWDGFLSALDAHRAAGRVAAIGETGLDYHYEPGTAERQKELFLRHLNLAADTGLPVIVHCREAEEDVYTLLSRFGGRVRGVVHSFTGSAEFALRVTAVGFMIGFSGIVTFRNADPLRRAAAVVPDGMLLIETDSPYLAPVPLRGRRNEPAFLPNIADTLAEVRGTTLERIADLTAKNAAGLFGFPG
ncbi:MAG: TatD family deoxyribonuclease [Lentisphaerae bacterium]|nr:TatD family deoxyribonuclease [Lentisphaerota bacterium]